tara:strand:+ start:221 stop:2965 length:2745 start_codon:yes stop_codon:yes gene_type:complete
MKNKINIILILFIFLFKPQISYAENIDFDVTRIEVYEEGNLIKGLGGGKAIINTNTKITADYFEYDKLTTLLKAFGNAVLIDEEENVIIRAEKIFYLKNKGNFYTEGKAFFNADKKYEKDSSDLSFFRNTMIASDTNTKITANYFEYDKPTTLLKAFGNAVLVDDDNDVVVKGEKIFYLRNEEKFYTEGQTFFNVEKKYEGETSDIIFLRNTMIASSDKKTFIKDKKTTNLYYLDNFLYNINQEILKGEFVKVIDKEGDIYNFNKAFIDLKNSKMLGQDVAVDFDNNKFDNSNNEPRLKGVTSFSDVNKTIVDNGLFTICKKRGDKCPPWVIKADKVTHDKEKKTIYYKNALLKIYDIPVWYYPYFFHPDPTVKRQSGFLKAATNNSKLTGQSIYLPYFYVISENKDLTIKPYIFGNKKIVLHNEYRYKGSNSISIADFSYSKGHHTYWDQQNYKSSTTKTHFFLNTKIDLDLEKFNTSDLEINVQKASNDTYLSLFKLKSVLFDSPATLTSGVSLALDDDYTSFDLSINQYETLGGLNSDRYTRSLPNYSISRSINTFDNLDLGSLTFGSSGYNTLSSTNVVETRFINNLDYISNNFFSEGGLISSNKALFKNVNSTGKNSSKYDSNFSIDGMSIFLHETSFPLIQSKELINNILTPKISFRYSPNKGRNISTSGKRINIGNIFDISRIGESDLVETGSSMTVGLNYQKLNTENDKKEFEFDIATNFRAQKEPDLPIKSTINRTTSDLVGRINFIPNNIFNIEYNFSLDNDFETLNTSRINTTFKTSKFRTDLTYLKESEFFGSSSYVETDLIYNFNSDNNLTFGTRRNRKLNLTEYYNLIYDYKNDCLIASIDYKKSYYEDRDIKPTEDLFFQITIVPITTYESTNLVEKARDFENKLDDRLDKLFKPGEWK